MARQGSQVHVGCTEIADGGGLMLDGEIILVPQLLRVLGGANMLVVDIRRQGRFLHGCLREDVIKTDFQLPHMSIPPSSPEGSMGHHSATRPRPEDRSIRHASRS